MNDLLFELFKQGKCPKYLKVMNFTNAKRMYVYRTLMRYRETNIISDNPRTCRPRSVSTMRMRRVVCIRISRNPLRSVRKIATRLSISRTSFQRIVKQDLGLKSQKIKVHYLSIPMKDKRLARIKSLLQRFAKQS